MKPKRSTFRLQDTEVPPCNPSAGAAVLVRMNEFSTSANPNLERFVSEVKNLDPRSPQYTDAVCRFAAAREKREALADGVLDAAYGAIKTHLRMTPPPELCRNLYSAARRWTVSIPDEKL